MKVSAGNINASHTEGNVMVAKLPCPMAALFLFFRTGQAALLRDRLEDLGFTLSEASALVSGQEVKPPVRPWEFVDEDLFGYLAPQTTAAGPPRLGYRQLWIISFQDRDLGTRSFERFGQEMAAGATCSRPSFMPTYLRAICWWN